MFADSFSEEKYQGTAWEIPYRLYVPENYSIEKKYPVVLFFHGAGERGSDNLMQLKNGLPVAMQDENSPLHSAIILAPQCPLEKQWVATPWREGCYSTADVAETVYLATAMELLAHTLKKYSCDKSRIYAMGISMGGFATWDCMARHSDVFAGGFACCGAGDPNMANVLKDLTIYAYHGDLDPEVPVSGSRTMTEAIQAAGGKKIYYKEFAGMGHWTWDDAYAQYDDIRALFQAVKK